MGLRRLSTEETEILYVVHEKPSYNAAFAHVVAVMHQSVNKLQYTEKKTFCFLSGFARRSALRGLQPVAPGKDEGLFQHHQTAQTRCVGGCQYDTYTLLSAAAAEPLPQRCAHYSSHAGESEQASRR